MTARLEFAKKAPKGLSAWILQSDETKIELFGMNSKHHVRRKSGTIPKVEHGAENNHAVGMFFSSRDWETSQDRGKDERRKYREILDENLLQSPQDLRLGFYRCNSDSILTGCITA